jgi:hypothetical protein
MFTAINNIAHQSNYDDYNTRMLQSYYPPPKYKQVPDGDPTTHALHPELPKLQERVSGGFATALKSL